MFEWIACHREVITLLLTVVGGGFVFCQWRKQIRIRQTEFAYQIMKELRSCEEIAETSSRIEHGQFYYTMEKFYGNRDLERKVDEFLSVLNYACYLLSNKTIGKRDFSIFRYKIVWTLKNDDIQAYLWNLHHWAEFNKTPCSFQFLIDWGLHEKLFPADFLSKQCAHFQKSKLLDF